MDAFADCVRDVREALIRIEAVEGRLRAVEVRQDHQGNLLMELQLEVRGNQKRLEGKIDTLIELLQPKVVVP